MPNNNSHFNRKHEVEFGLIVTETGTVANVVKSVACRFCSYYGRNEGQAGKRKRTSNVKLDRTVHSCWTLDLAGHGHDIPTGFWVWNLRWKPNPEIMKTRVTATTKKNQIGPFLSLKWRIYKYVRVRAVRFWFLTILIQRDSFYTQTIFWFSYFKKGKKKNLTL